MLLDKIPNVSESDLDDIINYCESVDIIMKVKLDYYLPSFCKNKLVKLVNELKEI